MAIFGVAACATNSTAPPVASSPAVKHVELSRAKSYDSLAQLAKESTVIARVSATNTTSIETAAGLQFTVTTVTVEKSFRGTKSGALLRVRQVGGPTTDVAGEVPAALTAGRDYLLFMSVFRDGTEPTDQYVITGDAGVFEANSSGTFDRSDPLSTNLPSKLGENDVQTASTGT